jgi:hypothetical protein
LRHGGTSENLLQERGVGGACCLFFEQVEQVDQKLPGVLLDLRRDRRLEAVEKGLGVVLVADREGKEVEQPRQLDHLRPISFDLG